MDKYRVIFHTKERQVLLHEVERFRHEWAGYL
ncbi:hypothetical protein Leryth_027226 [Lithospermum erythrorhizon]|nr:hypothetical protein Leryth_027226 [Lithospermum erythrorhizon]